MTKPSARLALFAAAAVLAVAGPARAGLMLVPAGLRPGDQFRAVFVSSATRDARSADIADYDQFITNLAAAAGIDTYFGAPVTWRALGSTAAVAALDRLPFDFHAPPLYRLDGGLVARSSGELWLVGPTGLPITLTELGGDVGGEIGGGVVWTGTLRDGTAFEPLGGSFVAFGSALHISGGGWVAFGDEPRTGPHRLYGYSSVLTVPSAAAVPEPASLTLGLVGLAALTGGAATRRWPWCRARAQVPTGG
jgi:hypothetical protein